MAKLEIHPSDIAPLIISALGVWQIVAILMNFMWWLPLLLILTLTVGWGLGYQCAREENRNGQA